MTNIKKLPLAAMLAMAVISFSNLFGLRIAGASVIIGVACFFINNAYEKQPSAGSGLDIKAIGVNLKDRQIWLWVILPLIMDAVSITLARAFLPRYIEHVLARTEVFVSFDRVVLMVFQLAVLALGEEIAWRAFFQKQLSKGLSTLPVLLISSVLFALGHWTQGSTIVVLYDVFFVFLNSILYGIVFYKSTNAWVSAMSHFIANLFSVIVLAFH